MQEYKTNKTQNKMLANQYYTGKEMQYNYTIDIVNKIIYLKITGDVYESDAADLGLMFRKKAYDLQCKLFIDMSEAYNRILIGTAYFWFERQYDKVEKAYRYIPTAYVMNIEQKSYYNFVQTIYLNQGINVRIFETETEAIRWLSRDFN